MRSDQDASPGRLQHALKLARQTPAEFVAELTALLAQPPPPARFAEEGKP
ncbi:hypothetical protein ACIQCF_07515 [Streptomyces sp. NPDC088353]